jgi:hypothetical protein
MLPPFRFVLHFVFPLVFVGIVAAYPYDLKHGRTQGTKYITSPT